MGLFSYFLKKYTKIFSVVFFPTSHFLSSLNLICFSFNIISILVWPCKAQSQYESQFLKSHSESLGLSVFSNILILNIIFNFLKL